MTSALAVVLVLGILIFVHELGHFLVAKFFKVGVLEFAIGFGPRLLSRNIGETTYSLRAVPLLGGFVRMVGDDPFADSRDKKEENVAGASPIEGELTGLTPKQVAMMADTSRWFLTQSYLAKMAIVLAGPVFNFVFGWILVSFLYAAQGVPDEVKLHKPMVGDISPGLPAERAGFKRGDRILSIDGAPVSKWEDLVKATQGSDGKELKIEIGRTSDGVERVELISVAPEKAVTDRDFLFGADAAGKPVFRIGLGPKFDFTYRSASIPEAIGLGALKVVDVAYLNLKVLYGLVIGALSPSRTIGGPITIITETAKQADEGLFSVLWMMVLLNVTLGVMNLLPIPVLDGGHITLFTLEKLRGKPLSLRFQEVATQIGMTILLGLMVFAVGNDILRLVS